MRFLKVNVLVGTGLVAFGAYLLYLLLPGGFGMLFEKPWDWLNLLGLLYIPLAAFPGGVFCYIGYLLIRRESSLAWRWALGLLMTLGVLYATGWMAVTVNKYLFDVERMGFFSLTIPALLGLALYLRLARWVLHVRGLGSFTDAELMSPVIVSLIALSIFSDLSTTSRMYIEQFDLSNTSFFFGLAFIVPILLAWAFYKIMIGLSRSDVNDNKPAKPRRSFKLAH